MSLVKTIVFLGLMIGSTGGFIITEMASLTSPSNKNGGRFASALVAKNPSAELVDAADVYAWLIGGWDVRTVDYQSDGSKRENTGEWHFSWVLEGRAVQDVWISPPCAQRNASLSKTGNRYGTSLRVYDSEIGAWRVTWLNPASGAHDELIGRRKGGDIVQEGRDSDGNRMRWVFTEIKQDSFRWYGERSHDDGKTWRLEAEFFGKRKK